MTNNKKITPIDKQTLDKIMLKFLFDEPFFSDILRSVRKIETLMIPTAGVTFSEGSITLYWNPYFLGTLSTKQVFGLLKHECYHLIYRHLTSRKQDPHLMWNIATDLAINSTIPIKELPEGGLVPGESFGPTDKDYISTLPEKELQQAKMLSDFIKNLPKNKSSEWYMEQIMSNESIQEAIEASQGSCSSSNSGSGTPDPDNEPNGNGKGTGVGFDYHFENDNMSDAEKAMADAKIKEIVKNAAERSDRTKNWGSVSQSLQQEIKSLISANEIDWKDVLRYFCGTKQKANRSRSFKKINRKYPYIHPGRKTSYTSNIAVYIDQSGSVGDGDLELFFSSLNDLAKKVKFTIFHFDTEVDENSRYVWKKNKKIKKAYRTRGGGTCFNAAENHFRKVKSEFDGYIVMTDGYAPKPKTCISKRCWVLLPGVTETFEFDKRDTVVKMTYNK